MFSHEKRQYPARSVSPKKSITDLQDDSSANSYDYISPRMPSRKNSDSQSHNPDRILEKLVSTPIYRDPSGLLGEGKFGRVYKHIDGWVVKIRSHQIGPGEAATFAELAENEISMFNLFYGEGSAFGNESLYKLKENSSGMEGIINFENAVIFLKRIPGVPLNEFVVQNPTNREMLSEHKINSLLKRLKEKQIVHGDLNPGNIMIDPDSGCLNLIDFATADKKDSGFERDEDELRETINAMLEQKHPTVAEPEAQPGRRTYADLLRMQAEDIFDDSDVDSISVRSSDAERNVGSGDTHQSNIKFPWYQKLALRYMPVDWFKSRAIKKLSGYPIRPKVLRNGKYRSTSSFTIEECSNDEALSISSAFQMLAEKNIKWIKNMGSLIPHDILNNNRLAVEMNLRLTETIGIDDESKLYYKLTRRGGAAGEDVYALSQQSISEDGEFHVDIISVNPKTFFSRMTDMSTYASGLKSGHIDDDFNVRGLGQSIAILSTILAARKAKHGLKSVSTNAVNPFSENMFNKIVKK